VVGSGLFCTVHIAWAVLREGLDCSVQYIKRGLFCGRVWTVLYSTYCLGYFVGGSGLFCTVNTARAVLWEGLDCSVEYILRVLFCGRVWTVLYSTYCTGCFV